MPGVKPTSRIVAVSKLTCLWQMGRCNEEFMNDFDVVFLLLSTRSQQFLDAYLNLYNSVFNAGYHASIATTPKEIYGPSKRWRVVVIDGNTTNRDFDVHAITAKISSLPNAQSVVFITDFPADEKRWREAGVDVCVHVYGGGQNLCDVIRVLNRKRRRANSFKPRTDRSR